MSDGWLNVLALVSAIGCGLVGGIFFAFSTFIMRALERLPPAQGIAAMQSINITVINPMFLGIFFGTGVTCAILTVSVMLNWRGPSSAVLLGGSLLYILGTIVVTIACNVPRNDSLAALDPATDEARRLWADYVPTWTRWNHVRTIAALLAAVVLTVSL